MGKKRKAPEFAAEEQKRRKQQNPDHEYQELMKQLAKSGAEKEQEQDDKTVMKRLQNRDKSSGGCVRWNSKNRVSAATNFRLALSSATRLACRDRPWICSSAAPGAN